MGINLNGAKDEEIPYDLQRLGCKVSGTYVTTLRPM